MVVPRPRLYQLPKYLDTVHNILPSHSFVYFFKYFLSDYWLSMLSAQEKQSTDWLKCFICQGDKCSTQITSIE